MPLGKHDNRVNMRFTPVLVVVAKGVGSSKEVWVEVSLKYPENHAIPCSVLLNLLGQIRECPRGVTVNGENRRTQRNCLRTRSKTNIMTEARLTYKSKTSGDN